MPLYIQIFISILDWTEQVRVRDCHFLSFCYINLAKQAETMHSVYMSEYIKQMSLFEASAFQIIHISIIYLIFFSVVFGSITCFALFTHECDKKEKNGYKIRPFLLS